MGHEFVFRGRFTDGFNNFFPMLRLSKIRTNQENVIYGRELIERAKITMNFYHFVTVGDEKVRANSECLVFIGLLASADFVF